MAQKWPRIIICCRITLWTTKARIIEQIEAFWTGIEVPLGNLKLKWLIRRDSLPWAEQNQANTGLLCCLQEHWSRFALGPFSLAGRITMCPITIPSNLEEGYLYGRRQLASGNQVLAYPVMGCRGLTDVAMYRRLFMDRFLAIIKPRGLLKLWNVSEFPNKLQLEIKVHIQACFDYSSRHSALVRLSIQRCTVFTKSELFLSSLARSF